MATDELDLRTARIIWAQRNLFEPKRSKVRGAVEGALVAMLLVVTFFYVGGVLWGIFERGYLQSLAIAWLLYEKLAHGRLQREAEDLAERHRVQLAGCSVAVTGGPGCEPGRYGWSRAYQDVVELRQDFEAMEKLLGWSPRR